MTHLTTNPINPPVCNLFGIILATLFIFLFSSVAPARSAISGFTSAEIAWLETHDQLRVQLAEDWPPYNYIEDDKAKGYVNDYILLLADKLGLKIDFVRGYTWGNYVEMLETKKIDCITNMTITPERRKRFLFSQKSVVDIFNGILTLKDNVEIADLEKLRGETLAVVRGYAQEELLKLYYPDVNLLLTENLLDSTLKVMAGKADAAIGAHTVFNYYIAKHLLGEVISTPVTENIIFPSAPHHLAVNKEETILLGLLNKAGSSLSQAELRRLQKKWEMKPEDGYLHLSDREREYLTDKERFNLCVDPDWMPMESISNGKHIGMAADYMQLIAKRLGTEMNLIPTDTWGQTLAFARDRKCDLISLAMSTPDRRLYLHFSVPYITTPLVIVTKESTPYISGLEAMKEKRVGVKKGYAFFQLLRDKYPEVNIVEIATLDQGLKMVGDGSLQGFIGSLPTLVYTIQQHFQSGLKIAGNASTNVELRMGLRNDEPLLLSSMNKAIQSITAEDHQEILNRWVAVQYEEGTDYTIILRILIGSVILLTLLLYRQVTLKKLNNQLQQRNREILDKSKLLQDTQQQLLLTQYAVDSSSFPIFWLHYDPITDKSRIVHANKAAIDSLGYNLEELTNIAPETIANNLAAPKEETTIKSNDINGTSSPSSVFRRKNGTFFPVELHLSSFMYDEKHYYFIFFYDITKQQEMEVKLHRSMKMEAVGLMAGGVAHDLNNILSGIVAYPDILLHQLEEAHPMRPKLLAIKNSGERAAQVVDDLLTMARGVAAVKETTNLNTLITAYLDSPEFKQLLERYPRVSCSLCLSKDLKNINCSPLHIRKSLMNLVTNSYEATPQNGTVNLSTFNQLIDTNSADNLNLKPGDYVVFEVCDSGQGIQDSDTQHIFDPFYSKKQMGKSGTGLGLSIVWNTVLDHEGTVTVDNCDTLKGARFRLFLPATEEDVTLTNQETMDGGLHGNQEKILIIDDEPQQRDIACYMLELLGYTPYSVSSGEKAITRIVHENFSLVLLDMIMSTGIGGKETYAKIQKIKPSQKAVIVSGFAEDSEVRATQSMGAGEFVRKPYSLRKLAVAIKNALKKDAYTP